MRRYLIVGAGFAGAVHARLLAEAGHAVDMIDKRPHLAGNAFDEVDGRGVRVHRYGPHLFHTSNRMVFEWLSGFTEWLPYEHRVRARLQDGRMVPLPVNRETINTVFDVRLSDETEVRDFLARQAEPIAEPRNAGEHLRSQIGRVLTDLFFRPYTRKMWALDLEDLSAAVVKRIPIRFDTEDRYFPNDAWQAMPAGGYTGIFERMLAHPNIRVSLSTAFDKAMEAGYDHVFNSMPIDEYFGFSLGELPYRSIRFHVEARDAGATPDWAVTNYTDSGPFTRETHWRAMPGHAVAPGPLTTVTIEEPCDYRDNALERYYPVKTSDNRYDQLYERYKALAQERPDMTFIGRCGTYQYLDMDQVINQSLLSARRFLARE